jgi:enoyl-CoA hydratase
MSLWDLAKPVIAMIHGYAMAGGLELAGACDLAYAAASARLSHPVLRFAGLPDFPWFPALLSARHAMELHVAGREYDGVEAANAGLVNQAFPDDELETRVVEIAKRIAEVPPAVVTVNKRFVYAALEARGARTAIRVGNDLQAGPHLAAIGGDTAGLMQQIKAARKPAE